MRARRWFCRLTNHLLMKSAQEEKRNDRKTCCDCCNDCCNDSHHLACQERPYRAAKRMQIVLALLTLSILMLVLIPVVLHFSDGDLAVNLKFWGVVLFLLAVVALYGS